MKNLFKTLLVAGALVLPVATQAAPPAAPAAAQTKRAAGVWIDVRTPEEFKEGHLQDVAGIAQNGLHQCDQPRRLSRFA